MYVKICGITRESDRDAALEAGVDALGFIAYPKSPRYVPPKRTAELLRGATRAVDRVAVFVDADAETVRAYAEAGITIFQLHGNESAAFAEAAAALGTVWKATSLRRNEEIEALRNFPADRFLVDAYSESARGGTGTVADWDLAAEAVKLLPRPVLLAGGLTPENAAEAVAAVHPAGLDLSSGVEVRPGIKDPARIRAFMAAVRAL